MDGGNSKSDVLVFDPTGHLRLRTRGPGSGRGPAHVAEVVADLLARGGIDPASIGTTVAAVAGLDFPEDAEPFERALRGVLPAGRIRAMNDARGVLDARPDASPALVLVCGAGLNAVAEGPAGVATVPAIDWMSGDHGGGEALAREAVRLAYRGWDGRGPRTALSTTIPALAGAADPRELARLLRDGAVDEATLHAFVPATVAAADAGDAVAAAAVAFTADEAVALALEVTGRAWDGTRPAAGTPALLVGGLFTADRFRDHVVARLTDAGFTPRRFDGPPVLGAAQVAARDAGLDPAATTRLRAELEGTHA